MRKLFVKAIEWLRSRVTAFVKVKGEGLKVKDTQGMYEDKNVLKVKGDRLEASKGRNSIAERPRNDDGKSFNSHLSSFNSKLTIPDIERLLREKYELRYNALTEQSEYRAKGSDAAFQAVTQRVYKTWMADLQSDGYSVWWAEGVHIAAESMHIEPYHPVTHYFESLPEWDGEDRLRPLMSRLTKDETMVCYLSRWLLALVIQAQGRGDALYANSVAPILVSEQQGMHKSTFCRLLLPPELRMFYTDNFDLSAESQCERRLVDSLLINLDEYDRYSATKQSTLKNLMQMTTLRMRKAYAKQCCTLPRIASFIGTSNSHALLTDESGSRRFLCLDIREMIDVDTPIDHPQLYAQCMHLLTHGERHWFTADEVRDIEKRNRHFRRHQPVEELFFRHYRMPRKGEVPQMLSATDIYEHLHRTNARLMDKVSAYRFGSILRTMGVTRHQSHDRRVYAVVPLNES